MMRTFTANQLRDVGERIFVAAGTEAATAHILVDHLINANLAGHDSHGVLRIPAYLQSVKKGGIIPGNQPKIARDRSVAVIVDGGWTFGQVAARFATDLAIARAKEHGLCLVGVVRCNHIGRLGEYPTIAASAGVVLLVTVGGLGPSAAPFGGRAGVLGTNPISIGFPAGQHPDLMVDFATTSIAGGKVMVARAKNEPVPSGTLLDKNGEPTTDPNAYFDGGCLLPFGGHKGYGLSIASVLLSQILVGAQDYADDSGRGSASFFLAIDSEIFRSRPVVESEADATFEQIKRVPPAEGFSEVLIPGEPEVKTRERRLSEGIPVPEATWSAIREAAASVGVDLSD